jgi:hypothetical protein
MKVCWERAHKKHARYLRVLVKRLNGSEHLALRGVKRQHVVCHGNASGLGTLSNAALIRKVIWARAASMRAVATGAPSKS